MAAKKPGPYYTFLIGLIISALCTIPLAILQFTKRNDCNNSDVNDDTLNAFNMISCISCILLSVCLVGMGIWDLDKHKLVHMGFTSGVLGGSNIHMFFSCLWDSFAKSNDKIDCFDDFKDDINVSGIIVFRWIVASIIIFLDCAVSFGWMYAIYLSDKNKKSTDISDQEKETVESRVKCLISTAAVGEYIYFFLFVVFIMLFLPTDFI